mgnify:CR=1 FL=1
MLLLHGVEHTRACLTDLDPDLVLGSRGGLHLLIHHVPLSANWWGLEFCRLNILWAVQGHGLEELALSYLDCVTSPPDVRRYPLLIGSGGLRVLHDNFIQGAKDWTFLVVVELQVVDGGCGFVRFLNQGLLLDQLFLRLVIIVIIFIIICSFSV